MSDKITITIKEFRMWLEGVEEMQDDSWVPDSKQWARIRSKINSVEDGPASQAILHPVSQQHVANSTTYQTFPATFEVPQTLQGGQLISSVGTTGLNQTKTPDIDTSIGGYRSNFG